VLRARPEATLGLYLRRVLQMYAVDCVIDVGAHEGGFGDLLRGHGYRGAIVSFEPVERTFRALQRHISGDPAWSAHRLALGERTGRVTMHVGATTEFSSFLAPSAYGRATFARELAATHEEVVEMCALDEVFDAFVVCAGYRRAFLKLDTQGADAAVLRGGQRSLDAVVGIQTELSLLPIYDGMVPYREVLTDLEGRGFMVGMLAPVTHDRRLRLIEADCVLLRDKG
jgi:FkbM family methyltransferase